MTDLPKQYNPKDHEKAVYKRWEEAKAFQPSEEALRQGKPPFVVTLPPPNITGSLHMGHALNSTIQDVLVRYNRMQGRPALWIPGTDHAGIATQNVVEKELRKEGKSRHDLGREKFLEQVWQWREKYGNTIINQLKQLGASCDWSRAAFTMDEDYVRAVQHTFIEYFKRGYIYRGNRIVNWCPRCASVISDLEIKRVEQDGTLTTLRYPFKDGSGAIEVATTRPETMLGDTAVAVNLSDERYEDAVGKTVLLPIMNREIPVVADERVDSAFGTGAVKITPAHDPLDAEIGETHHLPAINVIGEDGKMTQEAGEFAGLTVKEAREKVLAKLQDLGVIISQEQHKLNITLCDRCGTPIEPLISRQWFVAMSKLKGETIDVVQKDFVRFYPARWKDQLLRWMENVKDWTISRQLWWGHQIPVWWKPGVRGTNNEEGNYVVAAAKPEGDWEQDPDVLDTWFSSALWPFATLGWPEQTDDLRRFYPTSLLSTARDILYLWVARMIFSGLELVREGREDQTARIPFQAVLIHPTVLNKSGQRMSKSLGTGVDPLELIDQYGADATRFGLMYQMSYDNQAIRFDETAIAASRNFANKIWNLGRLLMSLPDTDDATAADRWITKRCADTVESVTRLLEEYKLGEAAHVLHDFVWKDFADWYVEILKVKGSKKVALATYEQILSLLHPFMPHITEVLWQSLGHEGQLIVSAWPSSAIIQDAEAIEVMESFHDIVTTVRSARTLLSVPPGAVVDLWVNDPVLPEALATLARIKLVAQSAQGMTQFPMMNGQSLGLSSEHITADSISGARQKLEAETAKLNEFIRRTEAQLANMRGKAPEAIISEKEALINDSKRRVEEMQKSLQMLQ